MNANFLLIAAVLAVTILPRFEAFAQDRHAGHDPIRTAPNLSVEGEAPPLHGATE